ncbi:28S ribosomal protein S36, mitochondrial-like isoform X2 [Actinia tenebrosa]|uniref:28S ribosomal protein S36, mitochondrial-like isoform X2 n=1 Tax=Actinia tenebrosa TaxID=6105 RepID=A0A6P8H8R6_ACTTE|nr:28S ribosomal protein S36, mitochondrial-like isoform X2 [Actinia tenebrosa]
MRSKRTDFFKMASTGRQILRRHNQLIKFPNRIRIHKNPSPNNSTPEISSTIAEFSKRLPHLKPLNPTSAFVSENKSLPTVDDAVLFESLPQRYRRRTISREEMEYIERGGPE